MVPLRSIRDEEVYQFHDQNPRLGFYFIIKGAQENEMYLLVEGASSPWRTRK